MGFLDYTPLGLFTKKGRRKQGNFLFGKKDKIQKISQLRPGQEGLYNQLIQANQGSGAGGSFGDSADYYRDLLSNDNDTFNQMQAPELRRFREQTIPDLSEQFAGMGSGGLSSSGFRNAAVNAGADLSERLGAIRAQLRQQGAQGLQSLGAQGLGQFDENLYLRRPGFLEKVSPVAGQAAAAAFGGPIGGAIGGGMFSKPQM